MQFIEAALQARFHHLLEKISALLLKNFPEIWQALRAAYQQPHRHYHTLQHIHECLQCFENYRHLAEQPLAVEFALWFHDAVYFPQRNDNELQSALWAVKILQHGEISVVWQQQVYELILATAHQQPPQTQDEKLIIDIDLTILAAPPERFNQYQQQIRAEYDWVAEAVYQQKRRDVLTRLYNHGDIYHLAKIKAALENAAKMNLEPLLQR